MTTLDERTDGPAVRTRPAQEDRLRRDDINVDSTKAADEA